MTSAAPVRRWRIPMDGQPPDDLPSQWVSAIAAVSRDLRCRRHGRMIGFGDVAWELAVDAGGWMLIGLARLSDNADLYGFTRGRDYPSAPSTVHQEQRQVIAILLPAHLWRPRKPLERETHSPAIYLDFLRRQLGSFRFFRLGCHPR